MGQDGSAIGAFFSKIGHLLFFLLIFTTMLVVYSVVFCSLIPLILYREFVRLLAKCFRPDLTHMMGYLNSWLALDRITTRPKVNIITCLIMEGDHDLSESLDELRSLFDQRVLQKIAVKGEHRGKLEYPELKQTWEDFMGFHFWKNEPAFDLKEHIRILDYVSKEDGFTVSTSKSGSGCTFDQLTELTTRLLKEPWREGFSPWEFLFIPNYQGDAPGTNPFDEGPLKYGGKKTCAIIFRAHHAIGGGKTWLNLFVQDWTQSAEPDYFKLSRTAPKKRSFGDILIFPFKLAFDFVSGTVESFDSVHPWHTPHKRTHEYLLSVSSSYPVQFVKDLKNQLGVSYQAILTTAACGAIRRIMEEAGQKVPKTMKIVIAFPLPGHPGGISVHMTLFHTTWPIGVVDRMERLNKVAKNLDGKYGTLFPLAFHWAHQIHGLFPTIIRRTFYDKIKSTLLVSMLPGPLNPPTMLGCQCVDVLALTGMLPGKLGAGVSSLTSNGRQRICINLDKSLFPSKEMFRKVGGFLDDELKALQKFRAEDRLIKKPKGQNEDQANLV